MQQLCLYIFATLIICCYEAFARLYHAYMVGAEADPQKCASEQVLEERQDQIIYIEATFSCVAQSSFT